MPGIACEARHRIETLHLTVERYPLPGGSLHVHLANQDPHKAFTVAFRTIPEDDRGAPHILEHTVLCGSQRYPVRDPFFAMLRRTQATFLNAITYPTMTCYPFATQIAQDFDNLLAVYLDAVFAPHLAALDFAQEGHRLEFDDQQRPVRKGIVYNEMKGAFSSPDDYLSRVVSQRLFPDTPARFDSGGIPADIPKLTHGELVALHRRWYTPANACFITYGALDVAQFHQALTPYLSHTGTTLPTAPVQPPHPQPLRVVVPVPTTGDDEPNDIGRWSRMWIIGDSRDLDLCLDADLLDELLLGHAGAPMRLALESSGIARGTGSSGVDAQSRTLCFRADFDGIDPKDYHKAERIVTRALAKCARKGFTAAARKAALDQLELAHRDLEDDDDPFGLSCCLRIAQAWNTDCDVFSTLDLEAPLAALRTRWADPDYGTNLLRRLLIDNPSHLTATTVGQLDYQAEDERHEAERCWLDVATLGGNGPLALAADAEALLHRQTNPGSFDLLPTLTLADIPKQRHWPTPDHRAPYVYTPRSNGLLDRSVVIDVGPLSPQDLALLPLLSETIGELGVGKRSYIRHADYVNRRCNGISAWFDVEGISGHPNQYTLLLGIEASGLAERQREFAPLLEDTLANQRFDEHERIFELLEQSYQDLREDILERGNMYASWAARSYLGGSAALNHDLEGLGHLRWLHDCVTAAQADPHHIAYIADHMRRLLAHIAKQPRIHIAIGDRAELRSLKRLRNDLSHPHICTCEPTTAVDRQVFTLNSSVSYTARVIPTVSMDHPDSPALAVAAHLLSQRYLLPRIREQGGAYGASASYNPLTTSFSLTSYRDPRLTETLADLAQAGTWLCNEPITDEMLREGILAEIGEIDAPEGPRSEAYDHAVDDIRGQGAALIDPYREAVLRLTAADIQRAAKAWLNSDQVAQAVITDPTHGDLLDGWKRTAL